MLAFCCFNTLSGKCSCATLSQFDPPFYGLCGVCFQEDWNVTLLTHLNSTILGKIHHFQVPYTLKLLKILPYPFVFSCSQNAYKRTAFFSPQNPLANEFLHIKYRTEIFIQIFYHVFPSKASHLSKILANLRGWGYCSVNTSRKHVFDVSHKHARCAYRNVQTHVWTIAVEELGASHHGVSVLPRLGRPVYWVGQGRRRRREENLVGTQRKEEDDSVCVAFHRGRQSSLLCNTAIRLWR